MVDYRIVTPSVDSGTSQVREDTIVIRAPKYQPVEQAPVTPRYRELELTIVPVIQQQ